MKLFTLIAILKTSIFTLENRFDEKTTINERSLINKTLSNISNKKLVNKGKDSSAIVECMNQLLSLEKIPIDEKAFEEL